jgi:hypothetical protein
MPIITKVIPEPKRILRTWSYQITGFKYKAKIRPPEHTLPKVPFSYWVFFKQLLWALFIINTMFYFGYGVAKATDVMSMKKPDPVERPAIVEPPPSHSNDINVFWKQFAFHNALRMYNKAKEKNATIKNVEAEVAEVNNIAGGEAEVAPDTRFKTGSELNRGLFFQEVHYKNLMLRNEINAIYNNYTGYVQLDSYKVFYQTPLFKKDIFYGLTVTTTFD